MEFVIYTKPVGQMRARACIRGKHAGTYKAAAQEQREQSLAALLAEHAPSEPMSGPLLLYVHAHFPIPASVAKAKRVNPRTGEAVTMREWLTLAARGWVRPTGKPDADNLAKHLKDVMGQVGFWGDDSQVVDLVVRKWYSSRPRWCVRIEQAPVAPLGFPQGDDGDDE